MRCGEACGGRGPNLKFEKYMVENGCELSDFSFIAKSGNLYDGHGGGVERKRTGYSRFGIAAECKIFGFLWGKLSV